MKKLIALVITLLMIFSAPSAFAESMKVGELTYLNITDADRTRMIQTIYEKYVGVAATADTPLEGLDNVEVVFFDNLNSMQMALDSKQIDAMFLPYNVDVFLADQTDKYSIAKEGTRLFFDLDFGMDFSFLMMEENSALRDEFNQAIADMKAEGVFDTLMDEALVNAREGKALESVEIPNIDGAETIKVAVTGDLPPLDYIDENGTPAGYNTAVLAEISKRIGKNNELVSIDSGARAIALSSGSVDVVFWCRVTNPDAEMTAAVSKMVDLSAIAEDSGYKDIHDASQDVPGGTVLTDPYYHDVAVPVFLLP